MIQKYYLDQIKDLTTEQQEYITEILEEVDFDKIQQYMLDTNWIWWRKGNEKTPSVRELKNSTINLYKDAIKHFKDNKNESIFFIGTGGINLIVWSDYSVNFSFCIEEYTAEK